VNTAELIITPVTLGLKISWANRHSVRALSGRHSTDEDPGRDEGIDGHPDGRCNWLARRLFDEDRQQSKDKVGDNEG
jgi:hypothetical protein